MTPPRALPLLNASPVWTVRKEIHLTEAATGFSFWSQNVHFCAVSIQKKLLWASEKKKKKLWQERIRRGVKLHLPCSQDGFVTAVIAREEHRGKERSINTAEFRGMF